MQPAKIVKTINFPCGCIYEYTLKGNGIRNKWKLFSHCNTCATKGEQHDEMMLKAAEYYWEQAIENS